jgi:hypothetical protein
MVVNMASLPSTITGLRSAARRPLLGASGACACGAVCVWTFAGPCAVAGAGAGVCAAPESGKIVPTHKPSTTICFLSFLMPSCRNSFLDEQPLLFRWQQVSARLAISESVPCVLPMPRHLVNLQALNALRQGTTPILGEKLRGLRWPESAPRVSSPARPTDSYPTCNFAEQLFRVEMRSGPAWDGLVHAATSHENGALRSWILSPGSVVPV